MKRLLLTLVLLAVVCASTPAGFATEACAAGPREHAAPTRVQVAPGDQAIEWWVVEYIIDRIKEILSGAAGGT